MSGFGRSLFYIGTGIIGSWAGAWVAGALGLGGTMIGSMMVGVGYMGGSFLGQMLFPPNANREMPKVSDYPIQTCDKGRAVPITYGTLRVAGNLVWMSELHAYEYEQPGAKGGVGVGKEGPTTTMYRRDFLISICEGARDVLRIWKGNEEVDPGSSWSYGGQIAGHTGGKGDSAHLSPYWQELTVFNGDGNEGLETLIGENWSRYKWDCCVLFQNWDLAMSKSLPGFIFEVTDYARRDYWINLRGRGVVHLDKDFEGMGESCTTSWVSAGTVDVDKDGNVLFVMNNGPVENNIHDVNYWPADTGPDQYRSIKPAAGWSPDPRTNSFSISCARFTKAGDAAYVGVNIRLQLSPSNIPYTWKIYKIDIQTGQILWTIDGPIIPELDNGTYLGKMAVDQSDYLYVYGFVSDSGYIYRYRPNGILEQAYGTTGMEVRDLWVDDRFQVVHPETQKIMTGFIFACGNEFIGEDPFYCATWFWINPEGDPAKAYSDAFRPAEWITHGWGRAFTCIRTCNNVIYVCGTSTAYESARASLFVLNAYAEVIAYWDPPGLPHTHYQGLPEWEHDPAITQCSVLGINWQGRLVVCVPSHDKIYELSSATLTVIESHTIEFLYDISAYRYGEMALHEPITALDANPSFIIRDLCTHRRYGAGMSSQYINLKSFEECWQYFQANDLLISVAIDSRRPLSDWIQWICSHCGGFPYWVGGQLYLGAWRNEDPEFHITRDHLVVEGDAPPVQCRKRKYSETCNDVLINWQRRADRYGPATATARDDVDLRLSRKRRKREIDLAGIKRPELATKMVWRYLIDSMYRFGLYSFRLGFKDMLLHVGRVGLLSDGFKITNQRIRITAISESKDGKGLDVEAVDDVSNLYPDLIRYTAETLYTTPTPITVDYLAEPTVTVYEDPEQNELHVSLAPGNVYTAGYLIYTSWDGNTYDFYKVVPIGVLTAGNANSQGTLLTPLSAAKVITWRDESFTVDIGTVTDLRTDITGEDFLNHRRLAQIGQEIMAYHTCTETATPGQWRVREVIRGVYQTRPVAHAVGETFRTLDEDLVISFTAADIGQTIYIKAVPYYRGIAMAIEDITAVAHTIVGNQLRPCAASLLRLTPGELEGGSEEYSGAAVTLYWNLPGQDSGFNWGGQDGGGTWEKGDAESLLVPQNGVLWDNYAQDPDLQGVDLVILDTSTGALLEQKSLGVVTTATLSKATDFSGVNPVTVEIYPRYARRAVLPATITLDDGT